VAGLINRGLFYFGAQQGGLDGPGFCASVYCSLVSALRSLLILVLLAPLPGRAEQQTPGEAHGTRVAQGASLDTPDLDLDRLLRPPQPRQVPALRRGGKDRKTWTKDFAEARGEIEVLGGRIAEAQQRIREASPDDWGFSPTGGGQPSDPEVLRLRAEIRRDRQSLEAAGVRLRDLEVEASLAGVPDEWREPEKE